MSEEENIIENIKEFEKQVTSGDKCKEDAQFILSPFMQMESQMSAAPLCLSIMGQLCLIATEG